MYEVKQKNTIRHFLKDSTERIIDMRKLCEQQYEQMYAII